MNRMVALGVGAVLVLLLLIFSTTYTVSFHEIAVRRTFGRSTAESVSPEPGLKWKWPILQSTEKYDTRVQVLESPLEEFSTADGQQIVVRAYLLWKIDTTSPEAVLRFDQNHGSLSDRVLQSMLTDSLTTAMKGAISQYPLDDLLGPENRLAEAEAGIVKAMTGLAAAGVQPVATGISQFELPERTTNSVIRRMEATRAKLAEAKRYEGNALAEGIASKAATTADTIRAFAELRAADIRTQANDKAAEYLDQMSEEESLAIFLVWLDTLEASLNDTSTFILSTEFAPFHLMSSSNTIGADGIPRAARDLTAPGPLAGSRPAP